MIWRLTKAILAAFGIGLIFDVLYFAAAFAITVLFSGAALLDPLNQWSRAENMWAIFPAAIVFHFAFLIFASVAVGVSAVILIDKTRINYVKTTAAISSFFLHCLFAFLIGGAILLFYKNEFFIGYISVYLILTAAVAPLKGVVSAAIIKGKQN
jgi:hypothetical protein